MVPAAKTVATLIDTQTALGSRGSRRVARMEYDRNMHTSPRLSQIRTKQCVAFSLATLAILSYVYAITADHRGARTVGSIGMPLALAKTDGTGTQYEMFLKLDGVTGDSADTKHRNEVQVDSYAWTQSRTATAGRPTMDGFRVTMPASKAPPRLFLFNAGALKISRAVLTVRIAGTDQDFLKWTFTDALPVAFQTVGNTHGDGLMDQVIFSPAKVEVDYTQPMPDGTLGQTVHAGWDQRTNKSVQ